MKTFREWISEGAPTNSVASDSIRGLGNVTGDPKGSVTNYAMANAIASGDTMGDMLQKHVAMHKHTGG
jgi:hypothetical protein